MRFLRRQLVDAATGQVEYQEFTLPTDEDLKYWNQTPRVHVVRAKNDYVLAAAVYPSGRVPIWVSFAQLEPQDEEARAWAADLLLKLGAA
jgi:hypothetical protein